MRPSKLKKQNFSDWIVSQGAKVWGVIGGSVVCMEGELAKQFRQKHPGAKEFLLPQGAIALPTGIDWQVHLRFPGQPEKEELLGGLWSALDGGFDTVLTMPNTRPFLDEPDLLAKSIAQVGGEITRTGLPLKALFSASATKGMQGIDPTDVLALARAGAMAITDDGWGVKSPEAQEALFRACAEANLVFLQHAEMHGHRGVASESAFQKAEGLGLYPRSAESEMIRRDIELLRKVPQARYHVLHVSTRESLALIERAKHDGLHVTAEVSPHHLWFANSDIPAQGNSLSTSFKMNPPLFSPEDRAALREALRKGVLDFVATDHAPHEKELKQGDWTTAPFGTRGMETALPVLISLMRQGELSFEQVQESFCFGARKLLPTPSSPTGIVFVNPEEKFSVTLSDLPGKAENSCFLGQTLNGRVFLRVEGNGQIYSI